MAKTAAVVMALMALAMQGSAVNVTFDNTKPRLDKNGNIMNAHDGTTRYVQTDGYYYYAAMEYGDCKEPAAHGCDQTADHCGFHTDHNITIWRSASLASGSWEAVANAVAGIRPAGIVYRPQMVFNNKTQQYVLWWNYVQDGTYMGYAVATAPHPAGPFALKNERVNVTRFAAHPGDYALFVDPKDGAGYVLYSAGFYMSIEQLTDDFIYSTGKNATYSYDPKASMFQEYFIEAPVFFSRVTNGRRLYYAIFGYCCCYCYQGSGAIVHIAESPLGVWSPQNGTADVACRPASTTVAQSPLPYGAEPTPGQGCLYKNPKAVSVTKAQQNSIIEAKLTNGSYAYLWTGDRWEQSPDGLKSHDPQTILPLYFNNDGTIQQMYWQDTFALDIAA